MKLRPLAVAIGGLSPILAMASGVNVGTAVKVSNEYLQLHGGAVGAAATIELGASYNTDDVITFTYNAAPAAATGATTAYAWPTSLAISAYSTAGGTATNGVLGKIDTGDTFVKYRVTTAPVMSVGADPVNNAGVHGTVTLPSDIAFNIGASGGDVTVTPSSVTSSNIPFDTYVGAAGDNVVVDTSGTQFKYAVTGLSNTIDVNSARKKFIASNVTATTISVAVAASTSFGSPTLNATAGTIAITLTGSDFTWLDSNTATNATGIQLGQVTLPAGGSTVGAGATFVSLLLPADGGTVTLGAATGGVIEEQSLALSLSQLYTGNSKSANATASDTGELSLNGSSVTVYAIPSSAAVSNFIWLTNTGSTEGDVTMVVHDNGTDIELGTVGTVAAKSEFDVTKAMTEALAAAGKTLSGGRVHLDIVTKVPATDVAVSAAYRVGDDRVNLLTSLETSN